jgi:hypothetical protein
MSPNFINSPLTLILQRGNYKNQKEPIRIDKNHIGVYNEGASGQLDENVGGAIMRESNFESELGNEKLKKISEEINELCQCGDEEFWGSPIEIDCNHEELLQKIRPTLTLEQIRTILLLIEMLPVIEEDNQG